MTQSNILITGATGNVGTCLVKKLAALNVPFRALVRADSDYSFLKSLPQADIVVGDLANERSVTEALQGIEKVFLLTNSSEQAGHLQLNLVNLACKANVKHIVKLSQFAADLHSPVRFLRYHANVENRIKELGMTYTFLRPNLYMQGLIAFKDYIKQEGKFYAALGDAKISAVDIRDIADVAVAALTEAGHDNKIYNITGPEAISHYQIAEILSKSLDKTVSFMDVSAEQMEGALTAAGFPAWQTVGLIEDYAHYARGEAAEISDIVQKITGHAAISFEQFANDHRSALS